MTKEELEYKKECEFADSIDWKGYYECMRIVDGLIPNKKDVLDYFTYNYD